MAGYAVECGLKSCILAHLQNSPEVIFDDKQFSVRCWTHDIDQLVKLAGCALDRDADCNTNPLLRQNWEVVGSWNEFSRYEMTSEIEARELYNAIADSLNGVMQWLKPCW